jgi:hypothetical protein
MKTLMIPVVLGALICGITSASLESLNERDVDSKIANHINKIMAKYAPHPKVKSHPKKKLNKVV